MQGTILNIQRFSLHDGPGIRTVVYLKGCPMGCQWCSNPESIKGEKQLGFDAGKCTQCMDCVAHCQFDSLRNRGGNLEVAFSNCTACGECISHCMVNALTVYGWDGTVTDVMATVKRDAKYYAETGGGVTFSGGEPFFQKDFLIQILKECKEQNIHTCIETSGYAKPEYFDEALPLTDIFLFDYKVTDRDTHMQVTGNSNTLIINNLKQISAKGAKIILRCIIIPGINDNSEHFRAVTRLSNELEGIIRTDMIPYHDFARTKYPLIGKRYKLTQTSVPHEQAEQWLNQLKSMGCENVNIL